MTNNKRTKESDGNHSAQRTNKNQAIKKKIKFKKEASDLKASP